MLKIITQHPTDGWSGRGINILSIKDLWRWKRLVTSADRLTGTWWASTATPKTSSSGNRWVWLLLDHIKKERRQTQQVYWRSTTAQTQIQNVQLLKKKKVWKGEFIIASTIGRIKKYSIHPPVSHGCWSLTYPVLGETSSTKKYVKKKKKAMSDFIRRCLWWDWLLNRFWSFLTSYSEPWKKSLNDLCSSLCWL